MLHANLIALSFIEQELRAMEVYITGKGIFYLFCSCDLDLDPMTFIHERDPYCLEIRYTGCAKNNFLHQGFRKLLSDGHTESTKIINHAASWVVNKRQHMHHRGCT